MTSLEYSNKTPSEYTNGTGFEYNKVTPLVLKEASLDYIKVTPLEVAHIDIHEYKDILKLDELYLRLLRLKRLSRIRHTRYKVWMEGYDLIYLPLEDAQIYKYILTLDTNKKTWTQQTGLIVVDKLLKDRHMEDYMDILEETLRPEDSGTIYI